MAVGPVVARTDNYALEIPSFDFPNWHTYYARNLRSIDSIIYLLTGITYVRGVWQNSIAYLVGDFVIDPDTAESYKCLVAHTAAATGTMTADRTANPSYWEARELSLLTSDNTWSGLNEFDAAITFNSTVTFNVAPVGLLSAVEDDTSPQLGGDLDLNGHVITGLEIGTDVEAYDATILKSAAIGVSVQAYSAKTTAIAALTWAADKFAYFTSASAAAVADITAAARTFLALGDPNADRVMIWDDSASAYVAASLGAGLFIDNTTIRAEERHGIALSDETTALTTGTKKGTFALPYAFTITGAYASVNTVSSSGPITIDINEAGSTMLSVALTIDQSEKTSSTATQPTFSDTALAADAEVSFDIDAAGTGAKGLKVWIKGYRT